MRQVAGKQRKVEVGGCRPDGRGSLRGRSRCQLTRLRARVVCELQMRASDELQACSASPGRPAFHQPAT